MGVSGQPRNRDRVRSGVERAGELAGIWDRLGEIIRTVEDAYEIDVTDLFDEGRAREELDIVRLDTERCENVETVAVGSTREIRRRGADRTRLGENNRCCGGRREGSGAVRSKDCDSKCTEESAQGPHVEHDRYSFRSFGGSQRLRTAGSRAAQALDALP